MGATADDLRAFVMTLMITQPPLLEAGTLAGPPEVHSRLSSLGDPFTLPWLCHTGFLHLFLISCI